jgi:hypothetical protein
MAKAKIRFSELSSLGFERHKSCNQQETEYSQEFLSSDKLTVQFAIDANAAIPTIQMIDRCTGRPFVYTITYNVILPNEEILVAAKEYAPGITVHLPSNPSAIGLEMDEAYRLEDWTLDGRPVSQLVMDGNYIVTGHAVERTYTLSYFIPEAIPPEVQETYPYNTVVTLKTPAELGMVLDPAIGNFAGWVDGGGIITQITITHDVIVEGQVIPTRSNLLRETRRWLNSRDLPLMDGIQEDFIFTGENARGLVPANSSYYSQECSLDGMAIGETAILSFVVNYDTFEGSGYNLAAAVMIYGTNRGDQSITVRKVYVNGIESPALPDQWGNLLGHKISTVGKNIIEVIFTKNTTAAVVNVYPYARWNIDTGTTATNFNRSALLSYFKLEDVTLEPTDKQRATPWIPHFDDIPDEIPADSYYSLNTDTGSMIGRLYPFSARNTPFTKLAPAAIAGAVVTYEINGIMIDSNAFETIKVGQSYSPEIYTPARFFHALRNLKSLDLSGLTNNLIQISSDSFMDLNRLRSFSFKSIPNIITMGLSCFMDWDNLNYLDLSHLTDIRSINKDFFALNTNLTKINIGSANFSTTNFAATAFREVPNTESCIIYAQTIGMGEQFKAKATNLSNWTISIGSPPSTLSAPIAPDVSTLQSRIMPSVLDQDVTTYDAMVPADNIDHLSLSGSLVHLYSDGEVSVYNLPLTGYPCGDYKLIFYYDDIFAEFNFSIRNELVCSKLIEYNNYENNFQTIFKPEEPFYTRIKGEFIPQDDEYGSESDYFRDQNYGLHQLSSNPTEVVKLSFGGEDGAPSYVGNKVNRILSCSHVLIDGERYIRADGASVTKDVWSGYYPKFPFKVSLERRGAGAIDIEAEYEDVSEG